MRPNRKCKELCENEVQVYCCRERERERDGTVEAPAPIAGSTGVRMAA